MFVRTSGFMVGAWRDFVRSVMVMHDCVPSVLTEHRIAINRMTEVDCLGKSVYLQSAINREPLTPI